MNAATLQAARLIDADFLFFLAGAAWVVSAGLALFFLTPRHGAESRGADRGLWLILTAAFSCGALASAADVLGFFGGLFGSPEILARTAHGAAAAAALLGVTLVPRAFRLPPQGLWRHGPAAAVVLAVTATLAAPALVAGGRLAFASVLACAAVGAALWMEWRRAPQARETVVGLAALGVMLAAFGVVFAGEYRPAVAWNGVMREAGASDYARPWQGAVMAAAGIVVAGLLWRTYLQACALPRVRARTGVLGLRAVLALPVVELAVLGSGAAWFVASSRQAENYAARRLQAEVATVVSSLGIDPAYVNRTPDPATVRRALEGIVRRSSSFIAAAGWVPSSSGEPQLLAAVTRDSAPVPFDAARLLPDRRELETVRAEGGVRWMRGRSAFEQAIVFSPAPAWREGRVMVSLAVDARDLAGLVAVQRLQTLAILALAVVAVAIAVVYSIRTLNEAELRLLKESAEAENSGRNAFLGMISHEIRTPLQSVLGYAELAEGAGLPEPAARHVRAIRTQGAILLRIVQDILDFSALRGATLTLNPETVSLRELLDDVQRGMAGRANAKGIVFSTEIDGDVPLWVTVDRVRLTQVLLNLAVNAVKFTERGGVRVAVSCRGVAEGIAAIEILVSDTGPGISAAQMRRLFEPFRKMRDDDTPGGGGVGLGLAISRQIIELLGGTISAESVDGEGTAFRLGLSLRVATCPAPSFEAGTPGGASAPHDAVPSLAGLNVLLIDDNPYVRDLLRDFLKKLGAGVTVRADGKTGLEACGGSERFDVILLDLRLPDFQGADLAACLRAKGKSSADPWIVGISAGVSDAEIQATLERGVNDFMLKPVSMSGLAETIRMSPAAAKIMPDAKPVPATSHSLSAGQRASFLAELEPMFDRLEQSCLEEHGKRLGAEAHYLANGCMVAGFSEGFDACRDIEQLAEAGAFEAARHRIAALRSHFARRATAPGT